MCKCQIVLAKKKIINQYDTESHPGECQLYTMHRHQQAPSFETKKLNPGLQTSLSLTCESSDLHLTVVKWEKLHWKDDGLRTEKKFKRRKVGNEIKQICLC